MKLKTTLVDAVVALVLSPVAVNAGFYEMTKQTVTMSIS
jgi:hypothetical protein